jgi:hypothetical protein
MRKILLSLASLMLLSCATVSVDEPSICDSRNLEEIPTVPVGLSVPVGVKLPNISYSQQLDVSSTLSKITNVANSINVVVNQLVLNNSTGNLSWMSYVEVDIAANNMANMPIVQYTLQPTDEDASSINLPLIIDPNKLLTYLSSGPITLTFSISASIPQQTPHLSGTMCVAATATATKSL